MVTLLAFATAILILVVFHELGHFWVAKWCNVKVLRFSVGFGKPLWLKRRGETEWAVSAIPLGGYVKMLDEREGDVAPHELHRAFNRQSVLKRMAIVIAGPVANLLLAILIYWALFLYGVPGMKPIIGKVLPDTPAASAGMLVDETIVAINGQPMPNWQDARWSLLHLAIKQEPVELEARAADGSVHHHSLDLATLSGADLDGDILAGIGLQPWQPEVKAEIGKLVAGGPAERAGLQLYDRILSINGQLMQSWNDLVEMVRAHPGQVLTLQVERDDERLQVELVPDTVKERKEVVGKIGAAPYVDQSQFEDVFTVTRYSPFKAVREALYKTRETALVSLKMIGKMLVGEASLKNLSGPLTIADYAGQTAQIGVVAYLSFLGLISISLGVLNLLPVPLLDGGHLLYYSAELIKGSPVSERAWEIGQRIGVALLVTLMAFAFYNDISRLFLG